jgi:hypothetical protein
MFIIFEQSIASLLGTQWDFEHCPNYPTMANPLQLRSDIVHLSMITSFPAAKWLEQLGRTRASYGLPNRLHCL